MGPPSKRIHSTVSTSITQTGNEITLFTHLYIIWEENGITKGGLIGQGLACNEVCDWGSI